MEKLLIQRSETILAIVVAVLSVIGIPLHNFAKRSAITTTNWIPFFF